MRSAANSGVGNEDVRKRPLFFNNPTESILLDAGTMRGGET